MSDFMEHKAADAAIHNIGRCITCLHVLTCPTPKKRDKHPELGCSLWKPQDAAIHDYTKEKLL